MTRRLFLRDGDIQAETLWRRRWSRWSLIVGVWTLFGLFLASQVLVMYGNRGWPINRYKVLLLEMAHAYGWAALTPLILWLAQRFPIDRQQWTRNVMLHILASLFIGFMMRILHDVGFFFFLVESETPLSLKRLLMNVYLIFDYGAMIYWLILVVSYAFVYYNRYREGELKASRLATQLAQAELQALKMQLHPHFLFNTLHSISALMRKNADAADKMIARLGDFLRLTLDSAGTQEVTLQQELDFLKCYLEIESIRFQDRLTVRLDIDPLTLDARVPNLILQPIVENAIRYGIALQPGRGHIEIQAKRHDSNLRVQIKDNGPGIPLNGSAGNIFKKGLGLANTQARLQQLYGNDHRLDLTNAPGGGLTVTVEVPFKTEPNGRKERYRP